MENNISNIRLKILFQRLVVYKPLLSPKVYGIIQYRYFSYLFLHNKSFLMEKIKLLTTGMTNLGYAIVCK